MLCKSCPKRWWMQEILHSRLICLGFKKSHNTIVFKKKYKKLDASYHHLRTAHRTCLLCITAEVFGCFLGKFLPCLLGQAMSSSNVRRTPESIVDRVCMLLCCQASPEGLVRAALKVGQDLLTRHFLTLNEHLAARAVSSLKVNSYLKEDPSLTWHVFRLPEGKYICPFTCNPAEITLCFLSHVKGQQFMVGCSLKILRHVVTHHPFVHLSHRGCGSLVPL